MNSLTHTKITQQDTECMSAEVLHNSVGRALLEEVDESVSLWVFMCRRSRYSCERGSSVLVVSEAALFSILQTSDDM